MKMLSAVAVVATLLTANVFAGDHTINAVGRTGWKYTDNDSTTVANSSSFNMDYLRTTFAGAVTPSVKYYLTVDLLGSTGNDSVDGTPTLVDEAFVTRSFATGTALTFGKKTVFVGGREFDYLNFDRYSLSRFYNATPANQVGLTATQEVAGQTLIAQYFNGNKQNGTGANAQSKFGYAVGWNGNLMDGMIKPIVGYTVVPEAAGASTTGAARVNKGDDTYLGAGLQFNLPMGLTVEADYNMLTEKDAAGTVSAKQDLETTSIVGLVRYATERFSPFVKFISDKNETASRETGNRTAYDIGVEMKEAKDDMIRYHVVYSGSKVETIASGVTTKTSPSSIMVGLKFDAAILK